MRTFDAPRLALPAALAQRLRDGGLRVRVTGASGWLGSALLEMLESTFGAQMGAWVEAFGSRVGEVTLRSGRCIPLSPLGEMSRRVAAHPGPWVLFDFAYLTRDKVASMGVASYVAQNRAIRDTVQAALLTHPPHAVVYASSGAVYGTDRTLIRDLENNPYAALKVEDEEAYAAYAAREGVRIVVPRVFNLSGPYINKWSAYALSNLALQALQGRPMVIQARHPVLRSYMHVADVLSVATGCALDIDALPPAIPPFDTATDEGVDLLTLAQAINAALGLEAPVQAAVDHTLPADRYVGSLDPIRAMSTRYGLQPALLRDQIRDTVDYVRTVVEAEAVL